MFKFLFLSLSRSRSFVPNCGARFIIENDLNIYTEFHDVTPDKFVHLFEKLISYPEFDRKSLMGRECDTAEDEPDATDGSDSEDKDTPET